jgi:hypothetical protein
MTDTNESPGRNVFTVHQVLTPFIEAGTPVGGVDWAAVEAALINREDAMAEVMFLAGMQFGLFPQIVAEVLAEVGLGTPKSDEEREMIRRSFLNLMEALRQAQSGEGPMPQP